MKRLLPPVSLLLVCFTFYVHYYAQSTIRFDESFTYIDYARSPFTALFLYSNPNNHLLYSFLMWITTSLFGGTVIGIRYPAFIASILAVAWAYRLGKRTDSATAGLLAAAMLATMTFFVHYTVNARGYSMSVLLAIVYMELIFFSPMRPNKRHNRLVMLVTILLVLTLPTMVLLIGAIVLWRIGRAWHQRSTRGLVEALAPIVVGTGIGTLFYSYGFLNASIGNFSNRFGVDSVGALWRNFLAGLSPDLLAVPLIIGLVGAMVFGWRKHTPFFLFCACIIGTAALLAALQFAVTGRGFFARNYIYLLPTVALVAGIGGALMLRSRRSVALALVAVTLPLGLYHYNYLKDPTDVDALSAAIDTYLEPGEIIIMGCCLHYPIAYLKGYYLDPVETVNATQTIIVPTDFDPFDELYGLYLADTDAICTPAQWDDIAIYVCSTPK
jgi:uncharacterized membrane protein